MLPSAALKGNKILQNPIFMYKFKSNTCQILSVNYKRPKLTHQIDSSSTKLYRNEDLEEESFRSDHTADQEILARLKSDLAKLKDTDEPVKPASEELVTLDLDSFDHSEEETEVEEAETPEVRSEDGGNFFQDHCGSLGGSAVLQAFGRAAHNLLPDLVARDRFYETPFRPKYFRINFHPQSLDKFPPKRTFIYFF
jgi:hypothetical protein